MEVASDDATETRRLRFRVKIPKNVEAIALNMNQNLSLLYKKLMI